MSWVDKELKRRASQTARETAASSLAAAHEATRPPLGDVQALWARLCEANEALPSALRLRQGNYHPGNGLTLSPPLDAWLIAENGAGLGCNGQGIRYVWPKVNQNRSNNLWIRGEAGGYLVERRVRPSLLRTSGMQQRTFDESRLAHLLQCLVTGRRVTLRSIARRRLLVF